MPLNILFEPLQLGALALPNRVIMPALSTPNITVNAPPPV
jgi:2,4-dienoyl-CoA reductase-like NADH-dependent reductase (Old Yellow Enzyme family)